MATGVTMTIKSRERMARATVRIGHLHTHPMSSLYHVLGRCQTEAVISLAALRSVTAAYRRIIRSVFQPPSAITIGAVTQSYGRIHAGAPTSAVRGGGRLRKS